MARTATTSIVSWTDKELERGGNEEKRLYASECGWRDWFRFFLDFGLCDLRYGAGTCGGDEPGCGPLARGDSRNGTTSLRESAVRADRHQRLECGRHGKKRSSRVGHARRTGSRA